MRELSKVALFDRHSGKHVDAELYDAIADNNASDFENLWKPPLKEAVSRLQQPVGGKAQASINAQDAHWRWGEKVAGRSPLVWKSFAIECEGRTQGLMMVKMTHLARAAEQAGKGIVYVDLISSAPWNRPKTTSNPRFANVGRVLLAAAISLSLDEEMEGRIGLHSLSQSEEWYRGRCGMTEFDPDPNYQDLRYYEMTAAQAKQFIE